MTPDQLDAWWRAIGATAFLLVMYLFQRMEIVISELKDQVNKRHEDVLDRKES